MSGRWNPEMLRSRATGCHLPCLNEFTPHLGAFCEGVSLSSEIIAVSGCTEFHGQQIRSTVILNPAEKSAVILEDTEDSELKGPVVRQHSM